MKHSILLLSVSACAVLSACASAGPSLEPVLSENMGEATRANVDAMAIAPTDAERANTYIPFDRARRAKAIGDYRDGNAKEPKVMSTRGG